MTEEYLGDGLYAVDRAYQVELFCDRGEVRHWVALDDQVLHAFLLFLQRTRNAKIIIERGENDNV